MNEEWNNNGNNMNEEDYAFQTLMRNGRPKTMGWSLASLILGVISIACCCLSYAGVIFGIAAIIVAVIARRSLGYFDGMCIAGLLLGIFGVVFGVAMIILIESIPEEEWQKFLEEYMKELEGEIPDDPGDF